jgi:hypothetical protein
MNKEEIDLMDKMATEFAASEIALVLDGIPVEKHKQEAIAKWSYSMACTMLEVRKRFIPKDKTEGFFEEKIRGGKIYFESSNEDDIDVELPLTDEKPILVTVGTKSLEVCNRNGCSGTILYISSITKSKFYCTSCDYKSN